METKIISGIEFSSLPDNYIRPESERPKLSEVAEGDDIPIIDLSCKDRSVIIKQIGNACRDYGFFQVINHGVSKEAMKNVLTVAHEFFNLPMEEKMKFYSDDVLKTMRLTTSFNNWRDYLRFYCYPLEKYMPEWPSVPSSFKEIVSNYCMKIRQVGLLLEEAISESLGLDKDCLKNILGEQGQYMTINYYPACPKPELTYGLLAHTDPFTLTVLLQDLHVSGLQVLQNDKWLEIKPKPEALVVNLGDQIQALSNGKYTSVWHRAIVNVDKPRMSIASFFAPNETALIRAPEKLRSGDDTNIYRDFTFGEYYEKFWSQKLGKEPVAELHWSQGGP